MTSEAPERAGHTGVTAVVKVLSSLYQDRRAKEIKRSKARTHTQRRNGQELGPEGRVQETATPAYAPMALQNAPRDLMDGDDGARAAGWGADGSTYS